MLPTLRDRPALPRHEGLLAAAGHRQAAMSTWARAALDRSEKLLTLCAPVDTDITSRAGIHPQGPPFMELHKRGFTVYGMVKAALDRFTTGLAAEVYDDGIAVNSLAPWDVVATPGAGAHDLVARNPLEDVSLMAEAALALCSCDRTRMTGRIAYSQPLLAELQRRPPQR